MPFHYRKEVNRVLDEMFHKGIISPVTEPTEWVAPLVVAQKPNGRGLRLCVDLTKLNRYVPPGSPSTHAKGRCCRN